MPSAKTQPVPVLFLSGVILNWATLFLWGWALLPVYFVFVLLIAGTAMMFSPLIQK